jgi:hypothetical protein
MKKTIIAAAILIPATLLTTSCAYRSAAYVPSNKYVYSRAYVAPSNFVFSTGNYGYRPYWGNYYTGGWGSVGYWRGYRGVGWGLGRRGWGW